MAGAQSTPDSRGCRRPGTGLLYHAGGLGDFVLSLPAIFRIVRNGPSLEWAYWGPRDRLSLLPGFSDAPVELLREGQSLWGRSPAPAALGCLQRFELVLAFGGAEPPPWTGSSACSISVSTFPADGTCPERVGAYQRDQLDRRGVPRFDGPWLPGWRRAVLPKGSGERIVLQPGSGDRKKNLPAAVWRDGLRALRRRLAVPVLLLVGPAEEERGGWEELRSEADEVRVSRTLADLLGALSDALVYLGNDSGASHLSGALGVPTVTFFGPSDPRVWRPLGARVRVLQPRLECSPCTVRGPIACDRGKCLTALSGREFADAALALLERA